MSETNQNLSKHSNAIYYNHLLHFKPSGTSEHFPFLQGLMSNDLYPIWLKTSDDFHIQSKEDINISEIEVMVDSANADHVPTIEGQATDYVHTEILEDSSVNSDTHTVEMIDNKSLDLPAADAHETSSIYSLDNEMSKEENDDLSLALETLLPDQTETIKLSQNDVHVEPEMLEIENIEKNKGIVGEINESLPQSVSDSGEITSLSSKEGVEDHQDQENEVLSISEIMQGVDEISEQPSKKRKLKQSQKKILKKNILFFKELPELNSFNKWLIQQKPMEEGNLVKLLKLSKKAKKIDKKRQLNEGIEASIQKNDKLVSEVLAKILASQGHYPEAIEMYKQLILNIPEKSNTFAAEIDELNKKII